MKSRTINIEELKEKGIVSSISYWYAPEGMKEVDVRWRAKIVRHDLYLYCSPRLFAYQKVDIHGKYSKHFKEITAEQFLEGLDEPMRKKVLFNMDLIF